MKIIKKLAIVGIVLLLLLVGGIVVAVSQIDRLAKVAIERGATVATGSTTQLSGVSIGLFSGKFELTGLNIANPAGFNSPQFLSLGTGRVDVTLPTLMNETIELPKFTMDALDVNLERRDGKTNFGAIMDSLKKLQGTGPTTPAPAQGGEKRLIIRDLELTNITVKVDMAGGPQAVSELTRVTIPIERIKLSDVGKTGSGVAGSGVTVEELSSIIITAVLNAATEKGGPLIPADLLGDLKGRLATQGLDGLKMEVIGGAQAKVEEVGKKLIEDATKKAVDSAAEKLKNLIPGKK